MDRRSFLALSGGAALAASLHPNLVLADEAVAEIYQQSFVIDASGEAADFSEGLPLSEKSLKAAGESGLTAINWTVSMPTFEETVPYIAFVQQIAEAYPSQFLLVRKHADLATAKKDKKLGLIMAFQHPQPFDSDLDRITTFRRLGVRIMQLTYNRRSLLGDGSLEADNAGLSNVRTSGHRADEYARRRRQLEPLRSQNHRGGNRGFGEAAADHAYGLQCRSRTSAQQVRQRTEGTG